MALLGPGPAVPDRAAARAPSPARSTPRSATCRSSARTATPTRAGTPRTPPFPDPAQLFVVPDHYVFRMLCSQGVPLADLGVPRADGGPTETDGRARSGAASPRTTTCSAARPRGSGSTTPSRPSSASTPASPPRPPTATTTTSPTASPGPEYRPRALFERFNIEAIATTDSALDDLRWHRMIRDSGWDGRVVTAYRPDAVVDPEFEGFAANLARLGELTGCDTAHLGRLPRRPPRTAAPSSSEHGATSSDHGHPTARTEDLPPGRGRRALRQVARRQGDARGGRRLPRPDADRDGADEPRRRPRPADPPRLLAQPLGRGPRHFRPRQGLRHPDAAPTSSAR